MHLCIQHSPTTYLSTEKSWRWGRTVVHTDGSGKHLRQCPWTTALPPLRNLKDPIHDSAMSINATTSIGLPCHRLVGSSIRRSRLSRFHTQAHHRQPLARYPFIHSEEFNQYWTYPSHPFNWSDIWLNGRYIELNRSWKGDWDGSVWPMLLLVHPI